MKPKICFINSSKIWGGGESWQLETMLDFKEKAEVISLSSPRGKLHPKAVAAGIVTKPISTGNLSFLNPVKIIRAYRLLKQLAPHAIMFNTANDFKLFTMPAKWAGIPYRLYRRDNGKPMKSHLLNKILLRRGITHFLPCSNFIQRSALSKDPNLFPADKIQVIYNSINLENWDATPATALEGKRKDEEVIFGCIGRLSNEKGQLFLPEIAQLLKAKGSHFKILVAGTGPMRDEIEKAIDRCQVSDCVELLGFVESNKSFMATIDCLLIPSHWEGLSTVAIEAMAMNKPVIAFDVAGNPEVVIDSHTGFLVPPFDLEKFALAMEQLISQPHLINQLGVAGRQLAERQFSRAVTNRQLESFFI
jgi:glycosyltransferase involved in cell wall biosynthesis